MPRPKCPQLQAKGTWGEAQAEDQGGSTLAAKVAQFLAAIDTMRRLEEYIRDPSVSFYVWLRFLVGQRVAECHRRYLGRPGRDVGREVSIYRGVMPGASSVALAARLLGKLTSPSQAAMRAERKIRLQEALNRMDPLDREILVLRHYEQMTNGDAAAALGLEKSAASKRYTRALMRLKEILAALPGEIPEDRA